MSNAAVPVRRVVVSSAAAQVNGEPVLVGGNLVSWQIEAPAALGRIEVSNDGVTWDSAVVTTGDDTGLISSRPNWIRPCAETDAGGPRRFFFAFLIFKETG